MCDFSLKYILFIDREIYCGTADETAGLKETWKFKLQD